MIASTSRTNAACDGVLNELFDETLIVPLISDVDSLSQLLSDGSETSGLAIASSDLPTTFATMMVDQLGPIGCKTALRLMERAVSVAGPGGSDLAKRQTEALSAILDDLVGDEEAAQQVCEVF